MVISRHVAMTTIVRLGFAMRMSITRQSDAFDKTINTGWLLRGICFQTLAAQEKNSAFKSACG
jgi:hypothetical protein